MAAKKMTKAQLINALAQKTGHSKKDIATVLITLVELAYAEVKSGSEFVLPGLGKLVRKDRSARMGRNPKTGQTMQIPAKKVVKFRVAKACKEAIL